MSEAEFVTAPAAPGSRLATWRWRISLGLLVLVIGVLAYGWFAREKIAGDIIEEQLDHFGLDASYKIDSIGGTRQVISSVVIGDPARPDFTADRVSVVLRYRLGLPTIGRVELVRPRLYGSFRNGKLSFGSLDAAIFRDTGEPTWLPAVDLSVVDGRGLLATDYGPVGFKLAGKGRLDGGFTGTLAASAPALEGAGCKGQGATLFGKLATKGGKAGFAGPIRLARADCPKSEIALHHAVLDAQLNSDRDLAGFSAEARLDSGQARMPWFGANGANGTIDARYRDDRLTAHYTLALRGVASSQARMAVLTAEGSLRASESFTGVNLDLQFEGNGLRLGDGLLRSIAGLEQSSADTMIEPVLRQIRAALTREERGSRLAGSLSVHKGTAGLSVVVPEARLSGRSGASLLSLSRVEFSETPDGVPRLSGNFASGGAGLPRIVGRMERSGNGDPLLRMQMASYSAGTTTLAIPELVVAQSASGQVGFAGRVLASGALQGGSAKGLEIPVNGNWSVARGLAMWRSCTAIGFDRLELANLVLIQRGLTLCPGSSGAILKSDRAGTRIAAGVTSLELAGTLSDTPIAIRGGPVGFAWPGALSATSLDITLGPAGTESRYRLANLDAQLGSELQGSFDEADVRLFAVPLDVVNAAGDWRYRDGRLELFNGRFRLVDRQQPARFLPMSARDATLSLENSHIVAQALLREPRSDRVVTSVAIKHDLGTGIGSADLAVAGVRFDDRLQPENLSNLALGVIANTRGAVTGAGRIDWTGEGVTSSGVFSTEGLDFAAAFGPVKGASGTIVFNDLINLTTAPDQRLKVQSINPGIEIFDGELAYALRDGTVLSVAGGRWPFLGGTLELQPVTITFGASEERRYNLVIEGAEAGQFIERMELGNLSASGKFDGTVPIVFDAAGNGTIEGGVLTARAPGGNLSYVGELTYKDLSPIANFAFSTLRSLDYREMVVQMDGSLTGEIVTRVRFDGVRQGEGAKQNFVTRRIAKLPIRFNVNIHAPFYQLITSFKSMYDPAFVRDPRELGLLSDDGTRFQRPEVKNPSIPAIKPEDLSPDEPAIQSPESEPMP